LATAFSRGEKRVFSLNYRTKMTSTPNADAAGFQVSYADFVRTNPGTLAGRFMRMFWHPIYRSQDLLAGRRVPVKIMGEEFTLYRGESSVAHLLAHRCAHRGTQLSVGRVEDDCIRCFYHGWKYDGSGQCVEQPAEDASFAAKIRIRSYPIEEYLGLIFAYLGEGSPPPMLRFPELEGEGVLENHTFVRACNFFRHLELDPAHIAFVHQDSPEAESGLTGIPAIECQETDYGFVFHARRDEKVQTQHRLMPNASYFKVFPMDAESDWRDRAAWRVPVDDGHYVSFIADLVHVTGDAARRYRERHGSSGKTSPLIAELTAAVLAGSLAVEEVKDLGASVVFFQDEVALLAQGDMASANNEHLGPADSLVSLQREMWTRELKALAEGRPLKQWTRPAQLIATTGV
jgi:5,5'-dehydrodivanillate O-demethylase oxygenase subunit